MSSLRLSHGVLSLVLVGGTLTLTGAFALGRRSAEPGPAAQPPPAVAARHSPDVALVAPSVPPEVRDRFAGRWSVHGESLRIGPDLTGEAVWNAGPCGAGMCAGRETLRLTPRNDSLVGTITEVTIEDEAGRPVPAGTVEDDGIRRPGTTVTLSLIDEGVLERTYEPGGEGNPYLCADSASADWKLRCNI